VWTALSEVLGTKHLYFYDAIAPTVTTESIDMTIAWKASRYDKGGDDYVNCPFGRDEYYAFVHAVAAAEKVPTRDFERCVYFEGCMPIEEMVRRGPDTLAFGPMRPVGLIDPRTGSRAFACAQLRQDDAEGRLYNMVGFQTKMTYPEQRRIFRMIPGLARAEFVRLGSLHRNTYVDAPSLLLPSLQVVQRRQLLLAGQIVGVEGYVESAATGLLARPHPRRPAARPAPRPPPRPGGGGHPPPLRPAGGPKNPPPQHRKLRPPPATGASGTRRREEAGTRRARARRAGTLARRGRAREH